jgi:hypothetical protein
MSYPHIDTIDCACPACVEQRRVVRITNLAFRIQGRDFRNVPAAEWNAIAANVRSALKEHPDV